MIGMITVHFGSAASESPGVWKALYAIPTGRSALLFIVLAGIGVSLMDSRMPEAGRAKLWWRLGIRGLILLPLGLALQFLDPGVNVILQFYALYFVVAAMVVRARSRTLLLASLISAVVAPVGYLSAWFARPAWFASEAPTLGDSPMAIIRELVLTGAYPVLTWSGPLLFGLWLGRQDLRASRVRLRMVAGGAGVAAAAWALSTALVTMVGAPGEEPSWRQLLTDDPHGQMPLWLIGSTAAAVMLIGLALETTDRWSLATWPAVTVGQMALTVYVGHLLLLAWWPDLVRHDDPGAAAVSVGLFTLVATLACGVWRRRFARGPLEAVLRTATTPRR